MLTLSASPELRGITFYVVTAVVSPLSVDRSATCPRDKRRLYEVISKTRCL